MGATTVMSHRFAACTRGTLAKVSPWTYGFGRRWTIPAVKNSARLQRGPPCRFRRSNVRSNPPNISNSRVKPDTPATASLYIPASIGYRKLGFSGDVRQDYANTLKPTGH